MANFALKNGPSASGLASSATKATAGLLFAYKDRPKNPDEAAGPAPVCTHPAWRLLVERVDEATLHTLCGECGQERDWVLVGAVGLCPAWDGCEKRLARIGDEPRIPE